MESIGYDRFTSSEAELTHEETPPPSSPPHTQLHPFPPRSPFPNFQRDRQMRRIVITLGVLSLFLLILTFTVGIKFTQMGQQVSELMTSLQEVSMSIHSSGRASALISERVEVVRGPCDSDWVFYKERCYLVSKVKRSWEDAEHSCVQQGGHLLVLNRYEELDFISQIVEMHPNERYWIGLVEREAEGNWTWVDGTDFSKTEHFWDEGQPDDWDVRVNGEDCGQLHSASFITRRMWNDADCTLSYRYICESQPRRQH